MAKPGTGSENRTDQAKDFGRGSSEISQAEILQEAVWRPNCEGMMRPGAATWRAECGHQNDCLNRHISRYPPVSPLSQFWSPLRRRRPCTACGLSPLLGKATGRRRGIHQPVSNRDTAWNQPHWRRRRRTLSIGHKFLIRTGRTKRGVRNFSSLVLKGGRTGAPAITATAWATPLEAPAFPPIHSRGPPSGNGLSRVARHSPRGGGGARSRSIGRIILPAARAKGLDNPVVFRFSADLPVRFVPIP